MPAVGRTWYRKEAEELAREWKRDGYTPRIDESPAGYGSKTIYTVRVAEHVPEIPGGEFEITHPPKGAAIYRHKSNPIDETKPAASEALGPAVPVGYAVKELQDCLERMQKLSSNTGVRLAQAHLYSDALIALSQADACRLEPLIRMSAMIGVSMQANTDLFYRQIEDEATRSKLAEAQVEMLTLAENLISQALQANCSCRAGTEPARLIADHVLGQRGDLTER